MKTIIDLPPEVLYRILELGADIKPEPSRRFGNHSAPPLRLRYAALVAPGWTAPSKSLLLSTTELDTQRLNNVDPSTAPYFGRTIRQLRIAGNDSSIWSQLHLRPRAIHMADTMVTEAPLASLLTPSLLQEVQRISLTAYVAGELSLPFNTQLTLKTLEVSLMYDSDPTFFASLIAAAPDLCHLVLEFSHRDQFPHLFIRALLDLAPRLQHLTARWGDYAAPTASPFLCQLVANASTLKTLALSPISIDALHPILSSLISSLDVLDICVAHLPSALDSNSHVKAAPLLSLLNLPALRELKRWRLYGEKARIPFNSFEDMKEWRDACEARGIEERDNRRYFTD